MRIFQLFLPWPAPHWGRYPWSSPSPPQSDSAAVLSEFEPMCMLLLPYLRHNTQISGRNSDGSLSFHICTYIYIFTIPQEKYNVLGHIGVELPVQDWLQTGPGLWPPELWVFFLNWRWEKLEKCLCSIKVYLIVSLKRRFKGLTLTHKDKPLELIAAASD